MKAETARHCHQGHLRARTKLASHTGACFRRSERHHAEAMCRLCVQGSPAKQSYGEYRTSIDINKTDLDPSHITFCSRHPRWSLCCTPCDSMLEKASTRHFLGRMPWPLLWHYHGSVALLSRCLGAREVCHIRFTAWGLHCFLGVRGRGVEQIWQGVT